MRHLNLIVLRSREVEAARRFYECLGLVFALHRHGAGPVHYAAKDDGGVFEIYPAAGEGSPDNTGLGFLLADLEAAQHRLRDSGFDPGAAREHAWGTTFVVRDPDGRRVEVQAEV